LLDAIEKHHAEHGTSERVILNFRGPHNRALVLLPASPAGDTGAGHPQAAPVP
jgi:hypothetical protein